MDAIAREAEAVKQLTQMDGWKLIRDDIQAQMQTIAELLSENRLRTVEQTVTRRDGTTKTTVTTAETQIAENAGMYKAYRYLFALVNKIMTAPDEIAERQRRGLLQIEKRPTEKEKEVKTT